MSALRRVAWGGAVVAVVVVTLAFVREVSSSRAGGDAQRVGGEHELRMEHSNPSPPTMPSLPDDRDLRVALERSRAEEVAQRDRIRELQQRLADKGAVAPEPVAADAAETPAEKAGRCLTTGGSDCSFVEPGREVLLELAKCGLVWADTPSFVNHRESLAPTDRLIDAANLDEAQIAGLSELNAEFRNRREERIRSWYLALGGSKEAAEQLPPSALEGALIGLVDHEATLDTVRQVSRERAGLAEVGDDSGDPSRAYMRYTLEEGNLYEQELAHVLGTDVARDIRLALDGWGQKATYGKCNEPR